MKINPGETVVAIGATDGYRYVGIVPPLTDEEIRTMEWAEVLNPNTVVQQIDEFEPSCSMLSVAGEGSIDKDRIANEKAHKIAHALRNLREGSFVRLESTPVGLIGHNSSPFNPNTDRVS